MQTEGKVQTADCRPGVKCVLIHKPLDILKSSTKIECLKKLGSIPTCLACPVVVMPCFACLVFRTIANPFKETKTRGALNVRRRIHRWKQDEGN